MVVAEYVTPKSISLVVLVNPIARLNLSEFWLFGLVSTQLLGGRGMPRILRYFVWLAHESPQGSSRLFSWSEILAPDVKDFQGIYTSNVMSHYMYL